MKLNVYVIEAGHLPETANLTSSVKAEYCCKVVLESQLLPRKTTYKRLNYIYSYSLGCFWNDMVQFDLKGKHSKDSVTLQFSVVSDNIFSTKLGEAQAVIELKDIEFQPLERWFLLTQKENKPSRAEIRVKFELAPDRELLKAEREKLIYRIYSICSRPVTAEGKKTLESFEIPPVTFDDKKIVDKRKAYQCNLSAESKDIYGYKTGYKFHNTETGPQPSPPSAKASPGQSESSGPLDESSTQLTPDEMSLELTREISEFVQREQRLVGYSAEITKEQLAASASQDLLRASLDQSVDQMLELSAELTVSMGTSASTDVYRLDRTPVGSGAASPAGMYLDETPPPPPRKPEAKKAGNLTELGDFNRRFQKITEEIHNFEQGTSIAKKIALHRHLIHLYQDFLFCARTYGKIIISEVFLPESQKTIKPKAMGGVAGGEKFLVQNILFKFANDKHGLFGGNEESAQKIAGHELKSIVALYNAFIPGLGLPLCCIVDYRGFRLLASALLPINETTIAYGSHNSGAYVFNAKIPSLTAKLKHMCERFNLVPHAAGVPPTEVYGPVDMEVHIGTDRRVYLVDLSRLFPPEEPRKDIPGAHLFRLLRPEFCQHYPKPLCSDGFSRFIFKQKHEELNGDLSAATALLLGEVVPEFVKGDLWSALVEAQRKSQPISELNVTSMVHGQGINLRYLGAMAQLLAARTVDSGEKLARDLTRDGVCLLFVEMAARCLKQELRRQLRRQMQELKVPLEQPYIMTTVALLNLTFTESAESTAFLNSTLAKLIEIKFSISVSAVLGLVQVTTVREFLEKFQLFPESRPLVLTLHRLQKMIGFRFKNRLRTKIDQDGFAGLSIHETDFKELGDRVKHMSIVSHAQGYLLKIAGIEQRSLEHLQAALLEFETALSSNPNNKVTLRNCGKITFLIQQQQQQNKLDFSVYSPTLEVGLLEASHRQKARSYFLRAVACDPHDATSHFQYGDFLVKVGQLEQGLEEYLKALDLNSNHLPCLAAVHQLLVEMEKQEEAELILKRITKIGQSRAPPEEVTDSGDLIIW